VIAIPAMPTSWNSDPRSTNTIAARPVEFARRLYSLEMNRGHALGDIADRQQRVSGDDPRATRCAALVTAGSLGAPGLACPSRSGGAHRVVSLSTSGAAATARRAGADTTYSRNANRRVKERSAWLS